MIEYEKESENFDAVIIGSGQAGNPLTKDPALNRWKVAVVERGYVGGSCINYVCTPSKTLAASALTADLVRRSSEYGIYASASKNEVIN